VKIKGGAKNTNGCTTYKPDIENVNFRSNRKATN